MQYLTVDMRSETIERIKFINEIKENLKDAEAELEEVRKRDPLARTKSASEGSGGNTGKAEHHISLIFDSKDKMLSKQISEWKTMINDYEKGYRLLDDSEKRVLELKYRGGYKLQKVAKEMGYGLDNVKRIHRNMLRKMENNILKV